MRVVLKGIHKVKRRLASGEIKTALLCLAWRSSYPGQARHARIRSRVSRRSRQPSAASRRHLHDDHRAVQGRTRVHWPGGIDAAARILAYIKLIEDEFGDLPLAALADRRVRGEFKSWRDSFAEDATQGGLCLDDAGADHVVRQGPRHHRDQPMRARRPPLRGRPRDKIWTEQDIAAVLSVASSEIQLALILAFWTGQRQGDLLRLPWSAYDGTHHSPSAVKDRPARRDARGRAAEGPARRHRAPRPVDPDQHARPPMDVRRLSDVVGKGLRPRRHRAASRFTTCAARRWFAWRSPARRCRRSRPFTGHTLKDVEAILDAHYLGRDIQLAEAAVLKLEARTKL